MNVSGKNIISLIKTYTDKVEGRGTAKGEKKDGSKPTPDEVRLSEFSKDVQKIKAGLNQVEDVRKQRVKDLKEQIEAGTYDISGKQIAEKMIEKIIDEMA